MDDKMERWTVTAFDDAAARIALPPRDRWLPADRRSRSSLLLTQLTFALVAMVLGVALWLVADGRVVPASSSAKPAPSNVIRLVPGGTEAQTWGGVWSRSMGATVLRPSWLPETDLSPSYDVVTTSKGLYRYMVGYYPKIVFPAGPQPWHFLFIAEGAEVLPPRLGPGDSAENVNVRGQTGQLITATDGEVRVVWMENGIRYTIQAGSGIPASYVLRVADSLVRVVDSDGKVATP
jgi:hypothetical protein